MSLNREQIRPEITNVAEEVGGLTLRQEVEQCYGREAGQNGSTGHIDAAELIERRYKGAGGYAVERGFAGDMVAVDAGRVLIGLNRQIERRKGFVYRFKSLFSL